MRRVRSFSGFAQNAFCSYSCEASCEQRWGRYDRWNACFECCSTLLSSSYYRSFFLLFFFSCTHMYSNQRLLNHSLLFFNYFPFLQCDTHPFLYVDRIEKWKLGDQDKEGTEEKRKKYCQRSRRQLISTWYTTPLLQFFFFFFDCGCCFFFFFKGKDSFFPSFC